MVWPKLPGRVEGVQAVLFDMDGVVTLNSPSFHIRAWERIARERLALDIAMDDQRFHGGRNIDILTTLMGRTPDPDDLRVIDIAKEEYYRELARSNLSPVPGLEIYLEKLRDRALPCALVTSADVQNIDFVLTELGLDEYFPIRVCATDVTRGKPDPEPYLVAAQRLGISPSHCLVHEDAPSGVRSGVSAGCTVVALTTTTSAIVLEGAGAHFTVPDFVTWLELSEMRGGDTR
jgi:HAD superfamily hydrolase (TIGR01509 family)